MRKTIIATATLAMLVSLSACSSNDDDDSSDGASGDTSEFNPDLDAGEPPASGPGDDATAIAGLWNSSAGDIADAAYALISTDGRYSAYALQAGEGADGGNCYNVDGPFTMTLEEAASNTWSTSNDLAFTAVRDESADPDVLNVQFIDAPGDVTLSWPLVSGIVVDDVPVCAGDAE